MQQMQPSLSMREDNPRKQPIQSVSKSDQTPAQELQKADTDASEIKLLWMAPFDMEVG